MYVYSFLKGKNMFQSMIILDSSELSVRLRDTLTQAAHNNHLYHYDAEQLYDWVIMRAFSNILFLKVHGHVRNFLPNDLFETIYREIGFDVEIQVNQYILGHRLSFLQNEKVKMLVTYKDIVIVRSF